jgi:hypothetical protein
MNISELELGDVIGAARIGLRHTTTKFGFGDFADVVLRELESRGWLKITKTQGGTVSGSNQSFLDGNSRVFVLVNLAYHFLHNQGYAVGSSGWPNPPSITQLWLTDAGKAWINGDDPIPEDIRQYMTVIGHAVPGLDPVIEQYVREAVITFNREAYFASAVMLGAAAEKAVYLLAKALHDYREDEKDRKKLLDCIQKNRSIPALFELIRVMLEKIKVPYEFSEGATLHLLSFQDAIRVQRNEAVHPEAFAVTPARVRIMLTGFPQALRVILRMTNWLKAPTDS